MKNLLISASNIFESFHNLSKQQKLTLLQAILYLPICQCCVKILSLPILMRIFRLDQLKCIPVEEVASIPNQTVSCIAWAIGVINRRLPFWPGRCFAQALTARKLLHQHGIPSILYLGAKKTGDMSMQAHAWLCAENYVVTGVHCKESFLPIVAFS